MIGYGILLTILACGAFGAPRLDARTAGDRIVNGTDAAPGQYPFMVSLYYLDAHDCGASIINPNWILTAAHCVVGRSPQRMSVRAGTNDISDNVSMRVGTKRLVPHPRYDFINNYINDIAVVELSTPLVLSDLIQPVKLPKQMEDTPGGTPATVIGWGLSFTGGEGMTKLQTVDIIVYSDKECQELNIDPPHNSNICAGVPEGGKGQCTGDSGGPLLANGHQVGVVSWSEKPCGLKGFPGVYTEVSYYIDWINQHIQ